MQTKIRPFKNWEKLDINNIEKRKILCSVTFHLIALTCVIWSLYVLIERTAEEFRQNSLDWAFWTKLVVVAIGFTGGLVFMYIQCRMYFQLCNRWRQHNRIILIQPITEEILKNSKNKILLDKISLNKVSITVEPKHTKSACEENTLLLVSNNNNNNNINQISQLNNNNTSNNSNTEQIELIFPNRIK